MTFWNLSKINSDIEIDSFQTAKTKTNVPSEMPLEMPSYTKMDEYDAILHYLKSAVNYITLHLLT